VFSNTPITIALFVNVVVTGLIALIAGVTAYGAINSAVENSVKADVARDIAIMLERAPERGTIPDIAVLSSNINARMRAGQNDPGDSIYLLANASDEKIIGNASIVPDIAEGAWAELDGTDIGLSAGPFLMHRITVEPDFSFFVGRRLSARESLNRWFVPVMIIAVLALGIISSLLLGLMNHRFRSQVNQINSVFQRVEDGDLTARILSGERQKTSDDLSKLSANVDKALDEVERLLRGLESYSQVAAHELNHSISKLRVRIAETGNADIAEEADRLIQLVTHTLELAKIEATPGFSMKPLDLKHVIQSVISLYRDAFDERSVSLETDIPKQSAELLGSRPLIESALVNLVSNALKNAPTGTKVIISLRREDNRFSLSVRDFGPGVEDTDLDVLAALGRSKETDGNGFGLRHIEAVAMRHGAQFHLENASTGLEAMLIFRGLNRT
tara:strand:+ start:388 stop:1722 length:1335 start_codon:yes stop_codon:yes gene_type:complete